MKLPSIEVVDEATGQVRTRFLRLPGLHRALTAMTRRTNRWCEEIGIPEHLVVRRAGSTIAELV